MRWYRDAWLAVVRHLHGFQGRSSLKTWLLTITANTAELALNTIAAKYCWMTCQRPMAASAMSVLRTATLAAGTHAWHHDSPEALLTEGELRECLEKTLLQFVRRPGQRVAPA